MTYNLYNFLSAKLLLSLCLLCCTAVSYAQTAPAKDIEAQRQLLKDNLVVDHVNFSFDENTFNKLKNLEGVFEATKFSPVKTKQLEYDLVGITLRDGSYAEFLSRTKAVAESGFQMAIVWCSNDPNIIDVDALATLYPDEKWTGRSATHLDGREWYTTYQIEPLRGPYTTWGMFYHDQKKYRVMDYRINPPEQPFTFSEWVEAHVRIPESMAEDVLRKAEWFPHPVTRSNNQLHVILPTPNGNKFDLYMHIDPTIEMATLDTFSLRMLKPKQIEKVEGFEFRLKEDVLTAAILDQ